MNRFYFYHFLCLFLVTTQAFSLTTHPWFENINQHAARMMTEKKYAVAEKMFTRTDWKAVAAYRGKNYKAASKEFKSLNNELGFYNQGNALAYLGQYKEAIQSYEKALKINPDNKDAQHNRDLLKKLLEENSQDQKQQEQDQKQQEQDQKQQEQDQKQQEQDQKQQEQDQKQQEQDQKQQEQDQKQQDQDQSLRLVPDDPGGLLREKFLRDHWRRLKAERS
ncbi:MAG: tetratricopeptide repeat protein [Legionellaceae bacterium]|nr:tetratricopeptide repeat protein [Legionellaceae bacterium]